MKRIIWSFLLIILIACQTHRNTLTTYTKEEILAELNSANIADPYKFFLDLGHGYCHPSGSRISLFGDSTRWAIVFEKTASNNRAGATVIELNYFGNCLSNLDKVGSDNQFTCNTKWIDLISGDELESISADFELVAKSARIVKVRTTPVVIEQDLEKYRQKGIQLYEDDNPEGLVDFVALTRYLDEENRELFRANDEELRICIPKNLTKIMAIDKWHHKEYGYYEGKIIGTKPSEYETFQLIAEILVTKDTTKWKPTLEPTNDWRHWPEAGGL